MEILQEGEMVCKGPWRASKKLNRLLNLGYVECKKFGGGGPLRGFLLRKKVMLQEYIEDSERAPDLDPSRYHEKDWKGGRKGGSGFGQVKDLALNLGSTLESIRELLKK